MPCAPRRRILAGLCALHGDRPVLRLCDRLADGAIALAYTRGFASLAIQGEARFYRRRDGRMVHMTTIEMGPDYFVEGLLRSVIGSKLAYVDRRLRIRLRTRRDWASRLPADTRTSAMAASRPRSMPAST